MWLFVIFVAVPLIEIALFIQIGGWLTLWPTLGIVVATALLGTALVRRQGVLVLRDAQRALDELRDPLAPLAHGALILFAGALLLTPGFLTDALGFALLVPGVRTALLAWGIRRRVHVHVFGAGAGGSGDRSAGARRPRQDDVVEAEFRDITPPSDRTPHGPDGRERDSDAARPPAPGATRRRSPWQE